ncbi:hypothetical protein AWC38_SpisGene4913 [Stylophora pistillata]|uniref:RZ-type domain-containing protein n=2 Tax=Stylophora pistillata TaxID=50429 RepID=A0A2B4SN61_STYPI|nr:hypothetical protein AWC38_SpisGene4913 [Stylophora pistillata]
MVELLDGINKIEQGRGLSKKVEEKVWFKELRDKIVKSKHLTQGPWYKCKKGHIYPAAECSENELSIKCPDCLATVRTTESNSKAVPTPVKLSELMNMTFKNEFALNSKRRRKKRPAKTSKAHK